MNQRKEAMNIMIFLDCLNDTRLSTLAQLSQDAAVQALNNMFVERFTDDPRSYCDDVSFEDYKKKYSERDTTTLAGSFPTKMFFDLPIMIRDLESRIISQVPNVGRVAVDINIWPYKLSEAAQDTLLKALRAQIGAMIPVSLINVPISEISNEWIDLHSYVVLYIYDYQEWLDSTFNSRTDVIMRIPHVTFYFPALMLDVEKLEVIKDFKDRFGQWPDFFSYLRNRCISHMNIEWVSSVYYSIEPSLLLPPDSINANGP